MTPEPQILNSGAFLLMLGAILYVGVFASYIFETRKIPDVLVLILIGLLMGPVFHFISPRLLTPWMPIVGSIALGLILFEGGLGLELEHIIDQFQTAFMLAAGTFFLSGAAIALIYKGVTDAPTIHCLLLGTTLGCVSSAVILPIANILDVPEHVKTTINLEAALSDMLGVVLTLALVRLAPVKSFDPGFTFNAVVGAFTTAMVFAGAFGMLWLWLLAQMKRSPFAYMMTMAAVFVLYGLTEVLHGSGPMAALVFGAVLTNANEIARIARKASKFKFELDEKIRQFNTEVTFFARTFFFVYLGLVVSVDRLSIEFFITSVLVIAAIIAVRWLVVKVATHIDDSVHQKHGGVYVSMIPRGLTSAVLVGMVQAQIAGTREFMQYAFAIILFTNAIMTLWVYRYEKKSEAAKAVEEKPDA